MDARTEAQKGRVAKVTHIKECRKEIEAQNSRSKKVGGMIGNI
jgi:hypothetical protein